jgi:thioredoxin reductase (NADPH)
MDIGEGKAPGPASREFDVIVIGGGPAGLIAGIRCRTHELTVLLLEGRKLGGQLTQLYPAKFVKDYASYPEIRAGYLADLMVHHAREKELEMVEAASVKSIEKLEDGFRVGTDRGDFRGKAIILAIGMGLFEPSRLGVPGEEAFAGRGVAYAAPNLEILRGQKVVVVGGGDSAVENALALSQVAHVTLVHRAAAFRALESNLELLGHSLVESRLETEVVEINGAGHVEQVVVKNARTGAVETVAADAVVINVGFSPDLSLVRTLGVKNDGRHILMDGPAMHTNVPGIFACGDIVEYPGKSRQIHPATGEAFTAAEEAHKFVKKPYWAKPAEPPHG